MTDEYAHTPRRIQRKRTRGWRMPEGAVYVGRPTRWGNPFVVDAVLDWSRFPTASQPSRVRDRATAAVLFRRWLNGEPAPRTGFGPTGPPTSITARLAELRGRDLACWCPMDEPCHADVLLDLANADVPMPPGQPTGDSQ